MIFDVDAVDVGGDAKFDEKHVNEQYDQEYYIQGNTPWLLGYAKCTPNSAAYTSDGKKMMMGI